MRDDGEFLNTRLRRSMIGIVILFAAIILRLGQLQLVMGQHYLELSDGNRVRPMVVPALRGQILDREGRMLATNRPSFSVSFVYMDAQSADESIPKLAEILEMEEAEIRALIRAHWNRLYQPVRIRSDISPKVHSQIEERRAELPGVVIEPEPVRDYPYGAAAGHILGYVHQISERQLAQPAFSNYQPGSVVGQDGLEIAYEQYLAGQNGGRQVEVDARGRYRGTLGYVESQPGHDLYLTIDIELQHDIEKLLAQHLEMLRTRTDRPMPNARAGSVVILDVHTGAVLAMVNQPLYDPNEFASGISQARLNELNSVRAFMNRAIAGTYVPGSTFKMATALAGLEERKISPYELIEDTGSHWLVPSLVCWNRTGHGKVNLETAIAVSCNVYFYEVGRRVGVNSIARYASQLGLGRRTGIDLPGEAAGILPTTEWKERAFREGRALEPQFLLSEHMMAAMGQVFHSYTPLQMAVFASTLATGVQYQPYIVQAIASHSGEIIYEREPTVVSRLEVSQANLDIVRRGMLGVTRPGGTAFGVFSNFRIPVAGKTGTAENPHGDDHGWFVGYAPYDRPQVAIAVLVEHGGSGSSAAAPLARDVLARVFQTR
ncbi:MAG: penicillin-binding protein 2 [Bacillota bacterium]